MRKVRFLFILLCTLSINISFAQKDSTSLVELMEVASDLNQEDQQKILKYAQHLLAKSTETEKEKEERLYLSDDIIPTEETSNSIREFSRFMMLQQQTTEEKITEEGKPLSKLVFDNNEFNFGTAKEGEVLEHTFTFTNQGENPLYIYEVTTACGCTTPNWTKEAIKPGKKGIITVVFDTKTKKGKQIRLIKVLANTNPKGTSLFIKGYIED